MTPEKWVLEDEFSFGAWPIFRGELLVFSLVHTSFGADSDCLIFAYVLLLKLTILFGVRLGHDRIAM